MDSGRMWATEERGDFLVKKNGSIKNLALAVLPIMLLTQDGRETGNWWQVRLSLVLRRDPSWKVKSEHPYPMGEKSSQLMHPKKQISWNQTLHCVSKQTFYTHCLSNFKEDTIFNSLSGLHIINVCASCHYHFNSSSICPPISMHKAPCWGCSTGFLLGMTKQATGLPQPSGTGAKAALGQLHSKSLHHKLKEILQKTSLNVLKGSSFCLFFSLHNGDFSLQQLKALFILLLPQTKQNMEKSNNHT